MADTKITALTALTAADPINDVIPIVDVSDTTMAASGTTKKISVNNILGASGTATLASATITGDLTVDTSTLKVDSTNNRVGIGTASPVSSLQVLDGDITATTLNVFGGFNGTRQTIPTSQGTQLSRLHFSAYSTGTTYVQGASIQSYTDAGWSASSAPAYLSFYTTPSASVTLTERYKIDSNGIHTWLNVGGVAGTAMTLNSTGLGIGGSPSSAKLEVNGAGRFSGFGVNSIGLNTTGTAQNFVRYTTAGADLYIGTESSVAGAFFTGSTAYATCIYNASNTPIQFFTNGSVKATLDTSGNLLVGKTSTAATVGGGVVYLGRLDSARDTGDAATFQHTTLGNTVGSISITAVATAYNIASDYRLKQSVQPLAGGLARVNSLKPSTYKWNLDGSAGEGFIAHELAEVVPFAVSGQKDAVNEDGSIKIQGVDLSKIVPILVAAIQELTARVQTLEAR